MARNWLLGTLIFSIGLTLCRGLAGEAPPPPVPVPPAHDAISTPPTCNVMADIYASCEKKSKFVPTMFGDLLGLFGGQLGFGGQFQGQLQFGGQLGQFQGQLQFGGQLGQIGQIQGQFGGQFGQIGQIQGQFGGQLGQIGQIQGQFQLGGFGGQLGTPISVARGAFKITENESPIPQNRIAIGYNYYNNVLKVSEVHREVAAVEQTFLDGDVSLGLRLPYFQVDGPGGISDQEIDDLSVIAKAALWRARSSWTTLSTGLVVTAPTGPAGFTPSGQRIHSTLLQPFLGWFWDAADLYLIGFSSMMFPTDSRDVTLMFNDVGVGYWLYRSSGDGLLAGIVPTAEVHVNTPLSDRSNNDPNRYSDSVNVTSGCHWVFRRGSSLGTAFAVPVTGPKLFDFEAIVHFNWRY